MRWLDSITISMDKNLSKLLEIAENRGVWRAAVHGVISLTMAYRIAGTEPAQKIKNLPGQQQNPSDRKDKGRSLNTSFNCAVISSRDVLEKESVTPWIREIIPE